jgi:hypothetical protein
VARAAVGATLAVGTVCGALLVLAAVALAQLF